jgi:ribonuclease R
MKFKKEQYRSRKEFKQEKQARRTKFQEQQKFQSRKKHSGRFPAKHSVEGTIRVTSKGVGYVEVEGMKEDIEIDPAHLNTALDLDRVRIILFGKRQGSRQGGEVTNILVRHKTRFVGTLVRENGTFFLRPDDQRMYRLILVPKHEAAEAKAGEKVFVEMTKWDDPKEEPLGRVLKVIGKPDTHETEMLSIVLERGFDATHDPDVVAAAEKIPLVISPEEITKRRDFRDVLTITIDPHDAKDFDDALSWKKLPNGNIEVGVHIADVSHYVTPSTRLDQEALERATSVYLVDRTIPMLPERLSNGICSLVPDEDRLTFSAVFELSSSGEIRKEWFGRTVIHSFKRFTYEEAQRIIEENAGEHHVAIASLNSLAKKLREKRIAAGAIAFEADEVKFELDKNGKPLRAYKKQIKDSNKLIEEFMLLANKRVATLIAKSDPRAESVFVYRVHEQPDEDRIRDLRDFLHGIGINVKLDKSGRVSSSAINKMLEDVRGHAAETMIQMATVRSMAKAVYTTKNVGHYGLGFEYYTHFTSPIRRYPDLMVHRLLASYLSGRPVSKKMLEEEERRARYCSQMEVAAAEAERASIKLKQCEYWGARLNAEWSGTISGVTEWGIYVEESSTKTEGMVHVRDLPNDFFFFEEKNYRLVGKESKKAYRLGDKIRVRVREVDLKKKQISLALS